MRRRELLSGLFAISAAGVLSGCPKPEKTDQDDYRQNPKNPAILKVVLQGPFAVVLKKNADRYTVSAFIPRDPKHQFRFQKPSEDGVVKNPDPQYHFTLGDEGLQISGRRPYIDHGLDDFFFDLGKYPEPDYFVSVDLPAPDLLTFIPPAEPVVMDRKVLSAPLNHVLEYKITNEHKVFLHSKQFGNTAPLAFSQIYEQYKQHGEKEQEYKKPPGHGPQFPRTRGELGRPAEPEVYTYFLGVGVAPSSMTDPEAVEHALDFFNHKLVPLFPNSRNLKPLSEIRNYGDPCTPMGKTVPSRMQPTVLRESTPKPRLLLVTAVEDCRAPSPGGG